jgi:hypothetical protein
VFLMRSASSIPIDHRVRAVLADPSAPFVAFAGLLLGAAVLGSPVLAWASFAGLAGYSLSGSA